MDANALGLGEKAAPTKVAKEGYDAMSAGRDRLVTGKPESKFIGRVLNTIRSDSNNAASHATGAKPGFGSATESLE